MIIFLLDSSFGEVQNWSKSSCLDEQNIYFDFIFHTCARLARFVMQAHKPNRCVTHSLMDINWRDLEIIFSSSHHTFSHCDLIGSIALGGLFPLTRVEQRWYFLQICLGLVVATLTSIDPGQPVVVQTQTFAKNMILRGRTAGHYNRGNLSYLTKALICCVDFLLLSCVEFGLTNVDL